MREWDERSTHTGRACPVEPVHERLAGERFGSQHGRFVVLMKPPDDLECGLDAANRNARRIGVYVGRSLMLFTSGRVFYRRIDA